MSDEYFHALRESMAEPPSMIHMLLSSGNKLFPVSRVSSGEHAHKEEALLMAKWIVKADCGLRLVSYSSSEIFAVGLEGEVKDIREHLHWLTAYDMFAENVDNAYEVVENARNGDLSSISRWKTFRENPLMSVEERIDKIAREELPKYEATLRKAAYKLWIISHVCGFNHDLINVLNAQRELSPRARKIIEDAEATAFDDRKEDDDDWSS